MFCQEAYSSDCTILNHILYRFCGQMRPSSRTPRSWVKQHSIQSLSTVLDLTLQHIPPDSSDVTSACVYVQNVNCALVIIRHAINYFPAAPMSPVPTLIPITLCFKCSLCVHVGFFPSSPITHVTRTSWWFGDAKLHLGVNDCVNLCVYVHSATR